MTTVSKLNVMQRINSRAFDSGYAVFSVLTRSYAQDATFHTKPNLLYKIEKGPPTKVTVTRDMALQFLSQMCTIRNLETEAGKMYQAKHIRGFCHLYSGQEACAVGVKAALTPNDSVTGGYRIHGWAYVMGVSVAKILGELLGRATGVSRGKGGSMHMYGEGFYGGNAIVGAQIPLAAGVAFAAKYKNTNSCSIALYGDGASNQGQVFEAFNMAKLWELPCVFIIENNGYGMGTSAARSSASTEYHTRAGYIPGISADGMDVAAVYETFKFVRNYVTTGNGPLLLELRTYRYSGHSMSDPGTSYRTRDEIEKVRSAMDPITSFRQKCVKSDLMTDKEADEINEKAKKEIKAAAKKCQTEPEPPIDELSTDVCSSFPWKTIRGCHPWQTYVHKRVGRLGKAH